MLADDHLSKHFRLVETQKSALQKLGITTVRDLLFHFPFRYEQEGSESSIAGLVLGADVSIIGTIEKLETKKSWKRKIPISEGYLRDHTGRIKMMWFNQPYIAKMYADGTLVKAVAKVTGSAGKLYLANPQLERVSPGETGMFENKEKTVGSDTGQEGATGLFAIYPESRGVTSLWFRHAIEKIMTAGIIEHA